MQHFVELATSRPPIVPQYIKLMSLPPPLIDALVAT